VEVAPVARPDEALATAAASLLALGRGRARPLVALALGPSAIAGSLGPGTRIIRVADRSLESRPLEAPRGTPRRADEHAVPWVAALGIQLPFRDGSFDVVGCALRLSAVRAGHDRLLLGELGRVLAPAGCLALSVDGAAPPEDAGQRDRRARLLDAAERTFLVPEHAREAWARGPAGSPSTRGDLSPGGGERLSAVLPRREVLTPLTAGEAVAACLEAATGPPARAASSQPDTGARPDEVRERLAALLAEAGAQRRALAELDVRLQGLEDRMLAALRPWPTVRAGLRAVLAPRLTSYRHHAPRPVRIPGWYHAPRVARPSPRISIVTSCRNAVPYLERTLLSVLEQGYGDLEYLVQDGASTDGTLAILDRYRSRLARSESVPDAGQADGLNRGFRRATGDILAYLNADDLLLPGTLHCVAAFFLAHPEVDVVYGHRVIIDERDREIGRWVLPPHDDAVLSWADWIPQETLFWRREIWERTGGRLDTTFQFALDWELLLRFRDASARFVRLPRFLGAFRAHAEQKSSRDLWTVGFEEMQRIRRRIHGFQVSGVEVARRVRPYLLRHVLYDRLYRLGLLRY
jgi:glycosyltransferase involved in cell wall biosynthesis